MGDRLRKAGSMCCYVSPRTSVVTTHTLYFPLVYLPAIRAKNHCSSALCGNNQFLVRFPFRLPSQPQYCGYPGFDLNCTGQKPVINLPYSGDFFVRDINYVMQEILLYDSNDCLPQRLLHLNLSSSPFKMGYSQNYTFLSCPPDFGRTRYTKIDCLSNSTASVLATSSVNLVRALNMCSIIDTLPVPVSWPQGDEWLTSNLSHDLILSWDVPNCGNCEARGGICGFRNSTSDQLLCHNDPSKAASRGVLIVKIIALSIVIPAITCSLCITCFICVVERRNNTGTTHNAAVAAEVQVPQANAIPGLDDSTIESYTKVVLGESRRLPGPNGATCPICLVDYHPKDTIRCIPLCEHCFHSDCIDEWLKMNGTCPLCRNSPSPARTTNT